MYQTPKRNKMSSKDDSAFDLTPDNRVFKAKCPNIMDKGPVSRSPSLEKGVLSPNETRRGRPRADLLTALILEGSTSPSSIKCTYCGRVFPREKSLQAHRRTHTGEKPYVCDFPSCNRKFAQSGQLKTHQRLHTGEKPFVCAAPNCLRSFTHANRHCPDHPDFSLRRFSSKAEANPSKTYDEGHNAEIREWLKNWDRRNKTSSESGENIDKTPKKSIFKSDDSLFGGGSAEYFSNCSKTSLTDDIENSPNSDREYPETSSYFLGNSEFDIHSETSPKNTSAASELPKKRWLREAVQDQSLWDSTNDLACPINWGEEVLTDPTEEKKDTCPPKVAAENQTRPSVLVCVHGGKSKEISNDEIQGAMALVELKNGINYRV